MERAVVPDLRYADTGLYQLRTTYNSGCSTLDSFYVSAFPSTTINVEPTFAICEGQSVVLDATGEGTFLWQPATGLSSATVAAPVASPRDSTLYKVTVTNQYGCKDSAYVQLYVYRNPVSSAGPDRTIVRGDSVRLSGSVSGTGVIFQWTPSAYMDNNGLASPVVAPPSDMQYTLLARSTVGCGTAASTAMVTVYSDIFIPNSFTPNKDGRNDAFRVKAADGYQVLQFQVFNRWGQVVYNAKDFSKGWDGTFQAKPQPEGSYVYFLRLKSSGGRVIEKKGTVTLLR
jgi:gliding motility-associated-like protein